MTQETETGTAATTTEGAATTTTSDTTATAAEPQGQAAATEGTEATAAEGVKTDGDKPQGAPDAYEFTAPEGREFSPEVLDAFSEVAKELNLPQESAQKVIDKIAPALAARQENALTDARAKWVADTKSDAEIGGAELAQKIALANTTFEKFGTPELRTLLDESGLGDHPEMLRWAHRVGKAISEDGFVAGRGANTASDPAKTMFPTMN